MENFDQIFTLLAEHEGISLNTDILETGLVNILALVAILIYTGRDFLGSLLEERKTVIVKGVQDAEDRLNEAKKRLDEAEKQLNQANLVIHLAGESRQRQLARLAKGAQIRSDAVGAGQGCSRSRPGFAGAWRVFGQRRLPAEATRWPAKWP